jgi:group II intron reverse transcriptase/maturase
MACGKSADDDGRKETASQQVKVVEVDSSFSEKPEHQRPRRLADWINPNGAKKAHSLIDKVYKRSNLEIAWNKVKDNQGAGGVDGEHIWAFGQRLNERLEQLHEQLRTDTYQPQPVRQRPIPKEGKPNEQRMLGIPTIYDRVCQQALLNRLEPIFEPVFDEANFGYRRGRSTKDALRKIWKEIQAGNEWIVDADLRDFFGSAEHDKIVTLVAQRVSDGRVLHLIEAILKAGCYGDGQLFPTERGTPQGGVISPLLSNILLTPFDWEMRRRGYQLTRYADDWCITCSSAAQARAALEMASRILRQLGVQINPQKTRIAHVKHGFEFLGFKIKRGKRPMWLPAEKIKSGAKAGALYAYPRERSVRRFKDRIRQRTRRRAPVTTEQLILQINPLIRGWGEYFKRAHVRLLFNQLDRWIMHRIWSHRFKRWRVQGWRELPSAKLYGELGLVNLVRLIPSIARRKASS